MTDVVVAVPPEGAGSQAIEAAPRKEGLGDCFKPRNHSGWQERGT